jgi:hypothetical protein
VFGRAPARRFADCISAAATRLASQAECFAQTSAAAPATSGVEKDVPSGVTPICTFGLVLEE